MEDSSHSTPSPMSSAASSQDSLHRGIHNPYQHLMVGTSALSPSQAAQAAQAAAKKKGVKSTLGRIFGKKDKHLKSMKDPHGSPYVTMPLSNSPSGGFAPTPQHQVSLWNQLARLLFHYTGKGVFHVRQFDRLKRWPVLRNSWRLSNFSYIRLFPLVLDTSFYLYFDWNQARLISKIACNAIKKLFLDIFLLDVVITTATAFNVRMRYVNLGQHGHWPRRLSWKRRFW